MARVGYRQDLQRPSANRARPLSLRLSNVWNG